MAKISSLVIGFFFVLLVVLQSAYADGTAAGSASPPNFLVCNPRQIGSMVDFGNFTSCDMCHPVCLASLFSISTCDNSTNTGSYICKCCAPFHSPSGTAAAAATTSLAFFSFSLILSLMLSRLFI